MPLEEVVPLDLPSTSCFNRIPTPQPAAGTLLLPVNNIVIRSTITPTDAGTAVRTITPAPSLGRRAFEPAPMAPFCMDKVKVRARAIHSPLRLRPNSLSPGRLALNHSIQHVSPPVTSTAVAPVGGGLVRPIARKRPHPDRSWEQSPSGENARFVRRARVVHSRLYLLGRDIYPPADEGRSSSEARAATRE